MTSVDRGDAADYDAAARQAAEVAVELSETGQTDRRRIAGALHGVADRTTHAAAAAAAAARRGAHGAARRGAGSAGCGVSSGMNWLTGQVLAMGPRLRIRDQATLRGQFPGKTDDEIAQRLVE